jgi:hypothetical protein
LARAGGDLGSTFQGSLPVLNKHNVAADWGLIEGKAQTHLPWDL